MLHDSDRYRHVIVDDYHGRVNSYNPKTARGNIQTMVYVSCVVHSLVVLLFIICMSDEFNL